MTKFFLALIAYTLLVQAGLVSAIRLRVLTVGADKCTPRKQAAIQAALNEATQLADAAITALANPKVIASRAFLDFLGEGNDPVAISKGKYQTVKDALKGPLVGLTGLPASANDITFICPPDAEELAATPLENPLAPQSTETCRGTFFALARDSANIVRVCPIFFDKRSKTLPDNTVRVIEAQPLAAAAKLHIAGAKIGGVPAVTIVHEFQHLSKVVGSRVLDLESTVDPIAGPPPPPAPGTKDPKVKNPAYSVDQCKALSPKNKILNAQNFAWFALDVFADKSRGLPCGTPPASPVATGSPNGSPNGSPSGSRSGSPNGSPGGSRSGSPKPPVKPLTRRAPPKKAVAPAAGKKIAAPAPAKKVTTPAPPKKAASVVAAPKKAVIPATGKKVTTAAPPKKAVPAVAAPKKPAPVVAAPKKVTTPAAPKKVAAPAPVAAKPKPNPLGAGTAPSGPRLARPARLSSSPVPKLTPAKQPAAGTGAKNGAKVGAGANPKPNSTTSRTSAKPTPTGKAPPAAACKVIRRTILQPISAEGLFVG